MKPHPEDSNGWLIALDRRQKKQFVRYAGPRRAVIGIDECIGCAAWMPGQHTSALSFNIDGLTVRGVEP